MSVSFYRKPRNRCKSVPSASSSSSDEDALVPISAYKNAEIGEALQRKEDYIRAVQELQEVVRSVFGRASKLVQAYIRNDASTAIACCDGSIYQQRALTGLILAVEQNLPKTKREALVRENKQKQVELHRRLRKGAQADASSETGIVELLPEQLLYQIFQHLDPYSLAHAACVCKIWTTLASSNLLWCKFVPGVRSLSPDDSSCMRAFRGSEQLKSRWRSRRRASLLGGRLGGRLKWMSAEEDGFINQGWANYHPLNVASVAAVMFERDPWTLRQTDSSEDSDSDDSTYS